MTKQSNMSHKGTNISLSLFYVGQMPLVMGLTLVCG